MDPDLERWISEARDAGLPVLVTGLALLWGVLGMALWTACAVLGLLMAVLLVWGAHVTFPPWQPGSGD